MTFTNLFTILISVCVFIILICILIFLKKYGNAPKAITLGKTLLKLVGVLLLAIIYLPDRNKFALKFQSSTWEKLDVPQIDSMMFLNRWDNGIQKYATWSKDSIRHESKIVEYDMFDLFKIQDLFINESENAELVMTYIKPNMIREEKRLHILYNRVGSNGKQLDTLSLNEAKRKLKQWGFDDELYKSNRSKYSGK